jgi:mannose/fructose/N-acetylgalactosamine-specific phosphotransferase system component IIC
VDAFLYTREFVTLVALGGVLALDDRAGWQSLLSQPLFAAVLTGAVCGRMDAALAVGVAMELVWLAILPMRGARRPDGVAGAVVGAGTACILLQHTGDVRVVFLTSVGVFVGLIVGEASGIVVRRLNRLRESRLERFVLPEGRGARAVARKLELYYSAALAHTFLVEAAIIAAALPLSMWAAGSFTGLVDEPFASGARWWTDLLPAFGAAAAIQLYWHRHTNRFLVLAAAVILVVLWIR